MKIPRHVAIIMDGNGRWAKRRGLPRIEGHRKGSQTAEEITLACARVGVEFLTLFAFSTENWNRPEEEVKALFQLLREYLLAKREKFLREGIRIRFIGRRDRLPDNLIEVMKETEDITKNCNRITVNVALDYGGRDDIVRAVNKVLKEGKKEVSEEEFSRYLDLAGVPDPDLLIRTAGEKRISNFLLWNLAYTELYFSDLLWPDFNEEELLRAFEDFSSRKRKFGRIGNE